MRESGKYLRWMPARFGCGLAASYAVLLGVFRLVESRASAPIPIHDELPFYVFILALLPATSMLLAMLERYLELWSGEVLLDRYLGKLGLANTSP